MRKMTARSNSDTTLKHMNNENGIKTIIKQAAKTVAAVSTHFDKAPAARICEEPKTKCEFFLSVEINLRKSQFSCVSDYFPEFQCRCNKSLG